MQIIRRFTLATMLLMTGLASAEPSSKPAEPAAEKPEEPALIGRGKVMDDAAKVRPLVTTDIVRTFLDGAKLVLDPRPIALYYNKAERKWLSGEQYAALSPEKKTGFEERKFGENFYYETKYGTPVAYARTLDLIEGCGAEPAMRSLAGKKIMDFGCGGMGQARMMAAGGATVVGVDVDPLLGALYSRREDQGAMPVLDRAKPGNIKLILGNWPAEEAARKAVSSAGPYNLIISKNTLKAGYIHPSQEVDKRMLLNLEVTDEVFVKAMFDALAPGGLALIYNICPAPAKEGEKFIPWAEGKSPFAKSVWEAVGFRVLKFDEADDAGARALFEALGYPTKNKAGDEDIFAWYTIAQKPGA